MEYKGYDYVCDWNYSSIEECVKSALEYDLVVVFISDIKNVQQLPSYEYKYYLDGCEVHQEDWEVNDLVNIVQNVTHISNWTKELCLEEKHNLYFVYTSGMKENFVETYLKTLSILDYNYGV